eukprot:scaffold131904_cov36-Tisochrysis_lutea.AAC.7
MSCPASLRVLGLPAQASKAEVKAAFLLLAKQWHPDRHSGPNKALAESKFKSIAEAYERLSQEHVAEAASSHPTGPGRHAQGSGTRSYGPRASAYESWGTKEQYGPAHHSRYDPFVGYMDFSANTPAGEARARTEARQRQRMRASLVIFLLGLGTAVYSHRSDQRRRENGELVDAFYNNVSDGSGAGKFTYSRGGMGVGEE